MIAASKIKAKIAVRFQFQPCRNRNHRKHRNFALPMPQYLASSSVREEKVDPLRTIHRASTTHSHQQIGSILVRNFQSHFDMLSVVDSHAHRQKSLHRFRIRVNSLPLFQHARPQRSLDPETINTHEFSRSPQRVRVPTPLILRIVPVQTQSPFSPAR